MKLKYPFLREDERRNNDSEVIRSEGLGQCKHCEYLVHGVDKEEAVKAPVRENGALHIYTPPAHAYRQGTSKHTHTAKKS